MYEVYERGLVCSLQALSVLLSLDIIYHMSGWGSGLLLWEWSVAVGVVRCDLVLWEW